MKLMILSNLPQLSQKRNLQPRNGGHISEEKGCQMSVKFTERPPIHENYVCQTEVDGHEQTCSLRHGENCLT